MLKADPVPVRAHGRLRWAARSVGVVLTVFSLVMAIGEGQAEGMSVEGAGLAAIVVLFSASLLVGWRWERLGGVSAILAGLALGTFISQTAGRNVLLVTFLLPLPIVAAGAMFLAADHWERPRRT